MLSFDGAFVSTFCDNKEAGFALDSAAMGTALANIYKTLDFVNSGIVLLDNNAELLFMNRAASMLCAKNTCPGLTNMVSINKGATYFKHPAIKRAIHAAQFGYEQTNFVSLPRTDGKHDVLMAVCTLCTSVNSNRSPVVALYFCRVESAMQEPLNILNTLFELTPTEAKVAWAYATGKSSVQIAENFNISATTVAFHRRNIFEKTRTNRQSELVALLLNLPTLSCSADVHQ